jgi:spermidine synthase
MFSVKKFTLPFSVFITGACILIIEVVAVRILSPYFGNTIFTFSSVIGVVLAALSIGYYLGGRISDKYPKESIFFGIILMSSFSVFILYFLNSLLLPIIGYYLSNSSGPLFLSFLLFFVPSFLLGMLSPFAIKLQGLRMREKGVGTIAGNIFFYSTIGSIFGSLFSGFFLIPHFGIDKIVISIAFVLFFLGFIPLLKMKIEKKYLIMSLILIIGIFSQYISLDKEDKNVVYQKDGVYERIKIFDGEYRGKSVRFLNQDKSFSAAMFIDSDELVFDYTKYYSLYRIFDINVKNVLSIGGGAYSIPKKILEEISDVNIDVVEIEPTLFDLAKKYFRVPDDIRLKNHIEDGRRFLFKTNEKYDLIFSDVYHSLFSIPIHFTTQEFFQIAKEKLNDNGIFMANVIGNLSKEANEFTISEMKTFKEVFPNSYFFAIISQEYLESQNMIFVGLNGEKEIDFDDEIFKNSRDEIIRNLKKRLINIDNFDFSQYKKLTDNFAPIEYLLKETIRRTIQ